MRKRIISMLLTAAMVLTLMPAAFAAEGETETKVQIGSMTLEDGGIYVPAVGEITGQPPAQYRVADKFVPTGDTKVPEGGRVTLNIGMEPLLFTVMLPLQAADRMYLRLQAERLPLLVTVVPL